MASCVFNEAVLVSGGMMKVFEARNMHPWLVEKNTLDLIDGKHMLEVTVANNQLAKFMTGVFREFDDEMKAMIEDLKVARRKATIFCVVNDSRTGEAPKAGQSDASSSPLRFTKGHRWQWADRLQTKRVKDMHALDALPPVIKVQLPALVGSQEPHIMIMTPGWDMLANLKIEFSRDNLQWLYESVVRHRNRVGNQDVKWCGRFWVASKLEDIFADHLNKTCV